MVDADGAVPGHGQPVVLAPGEGRTIPLGEAGIVTLKAVSAGTGGTLSAYEFVAPPATAGPPLHLHRGWDEAFYVLEGEMTFLIDGQTSTAPAGSFVFVPRGILHTFWNESAAPARQLTVFTPAGIEEYFEEVTQVMTAGGEDTLEAAMTLMEKHDMVLPRTSRQAYGALTNPSPASE
ncbi:MAG: cupin domain-containing protein [Chloroflexota bacterium]|nr:cupin domain-containing protein [Chloroflexota bacterium]